MMMMAGGRPEILLSQSVADALISCPGKQLLADTQRAQNQKLGG
jgi:hypothetical protein